MIHFVKLFIIYAAMISPAWAQSLSYAQMQSFLSQDLDAELKTADFVNSVNLELFTKPIAIQLSNLPAINIRVDPVPGKSIGEAHAILDIQNYIRQRLGNKVVDAAVNYNLEVRTFAGSSNAFLHFVRSNHKNIQHINKLPSIYEEWGIAKYLLHTEGKNVLYFNIPPSLRYAQHYATMIQYLSSNKENRSFLDQSSVETEKNNMKLAVNRIRANLQGTYDIVSFGYADVWLKSLEHSETWQLVKTHNVDDPTSGISANQVELRHKKYGNNKKILLISSKKTVWGELASFMLGAFLHPKLESVVFMGSAGAVSKKNSVYDLSVPESFVDLNGKVRIKNLITQKDILVNTELINFGARHGNTFSPIEQDVNYLKSVRKKRLDTIDVEQSLLARTVTEFNKAYRSNIDFGAVNLITDKPYNILLKSHADHDLDRIDSVKKQSARVRAVDLVLETLNRIEYTTRSCGGLFL